MSTTHAFAADMAMKVRRPRRALPGLIDLGGNTHDVAREQALGSSFPLGSG
jgi:hypothetical protein